MKQIKIISLIIGTIIGAGFISGKEIGVFFSAFGLYSYIIILPVFFCFYFFITKLLLIGANNNITNVNKLNYLIFKKNNKLIKIFTFISFIILSSTMISAINTSLCFENFSIEHLLCLFCVFIICCLVLFYDISSLLNICGIFLPIVILIVFIFCVCNINSPVNIVQSNLVFMPYNAINYVCRNVFLSYFVITKSATNLSKKQCKTIGFFSALILCVLMVVMITCELSNYKTMSSSMPLFVIAGQNNFLYITYFCCMLLAILTTLFSTLLSLKSFFNFKTKSMNILVPVVICIMLSLIKFDTFVNFFYPIIGVLGFYFAFYLTFFNSSFQNSNKNIHPTSNKTKYERAGHNKV